MLFAYMVPGRLRSFDDVVVKQNRFQPIPTPSPKCAVHSTDSDITIEEMEKERAAQQGV